jgi:glycosyltransferase involved in cell wall biosynthesis
MGSHVSVRGLRVVAAGISTKEICGVRDHAVLLAEALGAEGISCSLHWLQRTDGSLIAGRSQVRAWARDLEVKLEEVAADAVLLHYSVFTYSHQGVPLFIGPVLAAARRARLPVVTVLHEFVYPWTRDGLTGKAWAASQRLRLIGVMRASAAVLVTTRQRAAWLQSRPWLVQRPVAVAPVFSNLPPASVTPRQDREVHEGEIRGGEVRESETREVEARKVEAREGDVLGLFGYSFDRATVALVLDSLRLLHEHGLPARLLLLGAPGASSAPGRRWLEQARERGVGVALEFSGMLSAQELSNRLAACDILLFADPIGPTSRKTTLAASLASGRPVIALDGPQRWPELIEFGAARIVTSRADALADALRELLADASLRESRGARGREFAERVGLSHSARIVADLLAEVVDQASTRSSSHAVRAL